MKKLLIIALLLGSSRIIAMEQLTQQMENIDIEELSEELDTAQILLDEQGTFPELISLIFHIQGLLKLQRTIAQLPADQAKSLQEQWDRAFATLKTALKEYAKKPIIESPYKAVLEEMVQSGEIEKIPTEFQDENPAQEVALGIILQLSTLKQNAPMMDKEEFALTFEYLKELATAIKEGLTENTTFKDDSITNINNLIKELQQT